MKNKISIDIDVGSPLSTATENAIRKKLILSYLSDILWVCVCDGGEKERERARARERQREDGGEVFFLEFL